MRWEEKNKRKERKMCNMKNAFELGHLSALLIHNIPSSWFQWKKKLISKSAFIISFKTYKRKKSLSRNRLIDRKKT